MTLPTGWTKATLGEFTLERVEQSEPGASAVPYIDIGSIDRDLKRVGPTEKVTRANAPTRARQWVKSGDVLVSLTRPNLNAVAMVPPELDGAVASTGFDVLRPKGVLAEWVFNRVRSQAFVSDVCNGVQGVVYPAIRPADVRRHDLPIPPVQEQRRIVDAIDSFLTRLEDAVASLKRVQAKLNAYRASVLKAAVEGRLVPTEASLARAEKRDYESAEALLARILKERRRRWEEAELGKLDGAGKPPKDDGWKDKYPEPVAPDTTTLPRLPEGWCWASVDQVVEDTLLGLVRSREEQRNGPPGYPYLKMDAIGLDGSLSMKNLVYVDVDEPDAQRYSLRPNDILFNTRNSVELVGKSALVPSGADGALFNNNIMRMRVCTGLAPGFIALQMSSLPFRERLEKVKRATTSVAAIYGKDLFPQALAIAPMAEQERITDVVAALSSTLGATSDTVVHQVRRIARLRQSLLKWAFEGRLVDQDPSDEPADRLLARIQTERAAGSPTKEQHDRPE